MRATQYWLKQFTQASLCALARVGCSLSCVKSAHLAIRAAEEISPPDWKASTLSDVTSYLAKGAKLQRALLVAREILLEPEPRVLSPISDCPISPHKLLTAPWRSLPALIRLSSVSTTVI